MTEIQQMATDMVKENEARTLKLFPVIDQFTGEGCPGSRHWVDIDDLTTDGVHWYVPDPLLDDDPVWQTLFRLHSIRATCQAIYGYYNNDVHQSMVQIILKTRAKHDFFFFAIFYWRIRPKDFGENVPFKLRSIQTSVVTEWEEYRLAGKPLRFIILKARQAGLSTLVDCYIGWYQIMWECSKDSLIVGHQSDSSIEVEDMYKLAINLLPDYLFFELGKDYDTSKAKIVGSKTSNISHIPARNCKIKTGSAVNPEGARGGSSALIHYTEVAFWPETGKLNPRKLIKAATSAAGGRPGTMIFFESTPNGQNFFKDEWDRAGQYDDYGNKVSSFVQIFVPWWKIDMYRTTPDNILAFAKQLVERREDTTNGWAYLYWLWTIGATLEGIYWYMNTRKDYQSDDDMQQEFASDPIEAFKYSGTLEYDLYLCEKRKKSCRPAKFVGDIVADAPKGPLCMQNIRLYDNPAGCLQIWEQPEKDNQLLNRYLVSVDIGGKYASSDYSVISVFDRADMMLDENGTLNEQAGPSVVAEWYGHTDADMLAITCAQIASYYDNALLVIENNTAYSRMNGTDNDDVTELFFPVLIPLYDNIYRHNHSETKVGQTNETRYGFNTNRSTKVSVVKYLGICLRDNLYCEREKEALNEMQTFMKYPNGTFGAVIGKHDDRVMSRGIGLYVSRFDWQRYPVRPRTTSKRREEINRRLDMHRNAAANAILS